MADKEIKTSDPKYWMFVLMLFSPAILVGLFLTLLGLPEWISQLAGALTLVTTLLFLPKLKELL